MITQKFTPLKLRPNGELWLGLFCITTSTHKAFEHIAIFGDNFRYTYDFEQKTFLPFNENMELTLMEKAILLRAAKGLTTEQIADDLCRSVNTIKTHKSRLFDKLHVSSMNEAMPSYRIMILLNVDDEEERTAKRKRESRKNISTSTSYLIPGNRPLFPFRLCLYLFPSSNFCRRTKVDVHTDLRYNQEEGD